MPFRLTDVQVDYVHMVGQPATGRRFAIVKSVEPPMSDDDRKTNLPDDQQDNTPNDGGTDDNVDLLKDLNPAARAYVERLEKAVGELQGRVDDFQKAKEAEARAALVKRAEALKANGWDEEIDVDTVTEVEIATLEKAMSRFSAILKDAGVFQPAGGAAESHSGKAGESLSDLVEKEIVATLGREPRDDAERAATKQAIYKAHPGLLRAVLREENPTAAAEA
jgi:hypothetical protein